MASFPRDSGNTTPSVPLDGKRNVRWTANMDDVLVNTLHEEVSMGTKKVDNGWYNFQLQKVVRAIKEEFKMSITISNVRGRLRTLKKEYTNIHHMMSTSGFGWDSSTGRCNAEPSVWEKYLEGKKDPHKIRQRCCRYYDLLSVIYGNDTTIDKSMANDNDYHNLVEEDDIETDSCQPPPTSHEPTTNAPTTPIAPPSSQGPTQGTSQGMTQGATSTSSMRSHNPKCRRSFGREDALFAALESLGHAYKRIATPIEGIDWSMVEKRLEAVEGIKDEGFLATMELFEKDEKLAKIFLGLSPNRSLQWLSRKLGCHPAAYTSV